MLPDLCFGDIEGGVTEEPDRFLRPDLSEGGALPAQFVDERDRARIVGVSGARAPEAGRCEPG